jgi:hypothetical protein
MEGKIGQDQTNVAKFSHQLEMADRRMKAFPVISIGVGKDDRIGQEFGVFYEIVRLTGGTNKF